MNREKADDIRELIAYHKQARKASGEDRAVEKTRAYLRGDFLGKNWRGSAPGRADDESGFFTSKNLIYAVTDAAVTGLVGDNPKIAVQGENMDSVALETVVNGRLERVFDVNEIRETCVAALTDGVTVGRGVFKTGWGDINWLRSGNLRRPLPMPQITAPDPIALFFDDAVRLRKDISYYLECTPIRKREVTRRIKANAYNDKTVGDANPTRFPGWLKSSSRTTREFVAHNEYLGWIEVWEFYDLYEQKVYHYLAETKQIILEADLKHPVPYSIFALNHNGVDCTGLSEASLILNTQEIINDLLTLLNEISYGQIPRVGYDASRLDPDDLKEALRSPVGTFVPLPLSDDNGKVERLANLFFPFPYAEHPEGVREMLTILEDVAAFVSALADAARGQITNARTATEVAVLQAQMNNRLSGRRSRLFDALKDVADKCVRLDQLYLDGETWVRTAGRADLSRFDMGSVRAADLEFKYIPWNPIQQNPGVVFDAMANLYLALSQSDRIDKDEFDAWLARGLGAPEAVIRPMTEVRSSRANVAAMMTAQEGTPGPPGSPGSEVPPGSLPTGSPSETVPTDQPVTATRATPADAAAVSVNPTSPM